MKYIIAIIAAILVSPVARADGPAFGLASDYHAVRTTNTALTGLFKVGFEDLIQGYFVFENQEANNTGTSFGIAATYKHMIFGSGDDGFHIGGGIGFGQFPKDKSFFHLNGVAGFRFAIARQVKVHVDGGITAGTADSKTEFMIGGNSAIFGITLAYQL